MGMVRWWSRRLHLAPVHRMAISRLDGEIDLVAGCFSSDPGKIQGLGEPISFSIRRAFTRPTPSWRKRKPR